MAYYRSRAILITPRDALEHIFVMSKFPILYDCVILRADGNFESALELLLSRLQLIASDEEEENRQNLPKLWLVRDATLGNTQKGYVIRQRLKEYQLIEETTKYPHSTVQKGSNV